MPMDKLVKITLLLTALSTSVFAAPNQIIYEKVISDGDNISHIEPILDINNELSGIVYTDSVVGQIIYENIIADVSTDIEIGGKIFKTIHSYSEYFDTLYLYSLDVAWTQSPRIHKVSIYDETFTIEELVFPINSYTMSELTYADLRFDNGNLIVEISYVDQIASNLPDWQTDNYSRSYVIDLEYFTIIETYRYRNVFESNLTSEDSKDIFTISEIISEGNTRYIGDYESFFIRQKVFSETGEFLIGTTTDLRETYSYFADNFAPSSATEEIIIHAYSADLLEYYDKADHIACYSFADGIPTENWYNNEVGGIDFSYVYQTKDMLVGIGELNEVVMLNYLNGQISDSSFVDIDLAKINLFETGMNQPQLNLVGMNDNILKVYRFDIATDIYELHIEREIPQTFSLLQNHPNPFNGETRLEFSNTEDQFLKLSIFNILGQEIKILAASKFSVGSYAYYWDGNNDQGLIQSTGIYFARLESETSSQMIKLIYLK